jgi:hypothetical protein
MTLIFAVLAIFGSVALFKMAMVSSLINNALSLVLQVGVRAVTVVSKQKQSI